MAIIIFFILCFTLGIIVSITEKRKGWVDNHNTYGIYERYIKRALDFSLSLIVLILFSPIYLLLYILVLIFLGKPAVFEQERPGIGGEIFKMKKFRTMTNTKNELGELLPDNMRLTSFGRLLRRTSLDESLELISVIRGDLALVGPRPLLKEYLPYYNEKEAHRHDVRPGITGLAQISGRNNIDWDVRFEKDNEYVNNITFLTDLSIVLKTIKKVAVHEDVMEDTTKGETNFAEERKAGRI